MCLWLAISAHSPQGFSVADLLAGLQVEAEVVRSLEEKDYSGAQVELSQVLPFPHAHSLLVVVGQVAEVVVRAFAVAWAVSAQLLDTDRERETERIQFSKYIIIMIQCIQCQVF